MSSEKWKLFGNSVLVAMEAEAWEKVMCFVKIAPSLEVQGVGAVEVDEEKGLITITDIELVKQTVSSGHCDTTDEEMAKSMHDIMVKDPEKRWLMKWHSHGSMGAYHSSTDDTDVKDLMKSGLYPFLLSMVVNNRQEYDLQAHFRFPSVHYEDVQFAILREGNAELEAACKESYKANVQTITKKYNKLSSHKKVTYSGNKITVDFDSPLRSFCPRGSCVHETVGDKWRHYDGSFCPEFKKKLDAATKKALARRSQGKGRTGKITTKKSGKDDTFSEGEMYVAGEVSSITAVAKKLRKFPEAALMDIFATPYCVTAEDCVAEIGKCEMLSKLEKEELIKIVAEDGLYYTEEAAAAIVSTWEDKLDGHNYPALT